LIIIIIVDTFISRSCFVTVGCEMTEKESDRQNLEFFIQQAISLCDFPKM